MAVAPNPTKVNQFAYAFFNTTTLKARLYKGNSALDPATSTLLVSQTYDDINDVQFTPDGLFVIYSADSGSGRKIYRVAVGGGSPVVLDDVLFGMAVSPVVGSHLVAYSKPFASTTEVYTIDYTTGVMAPLTSLGVDVSSPTWSRDGSKVMFSFATSNVAPSDLYSVPLTAGAPTQITNSGSLSESFGFWNEDTSKIAALMFGPTGTQTLYVLTNNAATFTPIIVDSGLGAACYWTDSLGRSIGGENPHFQFRKIRRPER